ncbi:MAG: hypothetical protein PQJ59_08410 [Spirochaetales bacterium]|nr:hypothetical protein [Spirochaetales bacterium]
MKRIIILLMAIALVFLFTGCDDGSSTTCCTSDTDDETGTLGYREATRTYYYIDDGEDEDSAYISSISYYEYEEDSDRVIYYEGRGFDDTLNYYYDYTYDSENRLESRIGYNGDYLPYRTYTDYEYDENDNRLSYSKYDQDGVIETLYEYEYTNDVLTTYTYNSYTEGIFSSYTTYKYEYTGDNLTQVTLYDEDGTATGTYYTYDYDTDGNTSHQYFYDEYGLFEYYEYEYDSNDNLIGRNDYYYEFDSDTNTYDNTTAILDDFRISTWEEYYY